MASPSDDIDKRIGIADLKPGRKVTSQRKTAAKEPKTTGKGKDSTPIADRFFLDNGLTPEQEAYARCRAYGMNQKEAITFATNGKTIAVSAGSNMEKEYPLVRARINELSAEVSEKVIEAAALNKGWVLDRLKKVAERCMQAEPVMIFDKNLGDYVESGEYKFDSAGANRALELIGKELGMFATKVDVNHNHMMKLSEDQLLTQARMLAEELGLEMPLQLQHDRSTDH